MTLRKARDYDTYARSLMSPPDLSESVFDGLNLQGLMLAGANARKSSFVGADLRNANLSRGNFSSCDFSGANLMGAVMRRSSFEGAKFQNANLTNADFSGSNLSGARLMGATKDNVDLSNCEMMRARFR